MPQKTATFEKMTGKTASNAFKGLDVCQKNAQRMPHVKTVKRGGVSYCYFNMGPRAEGGYDYRRMTARTPFQFRRQHSEMLAERDRLLALPQTLADGVDQYLKSEWFARLSDSTRRTYSAALFRLSQHIGSISLADIAASDFVAPLASAQTVGTRTQWAKVYCALFSWLRREAKMPQSCQPTDGLISRKKSGVWHYVYFIRAGVDGPIKIGRANDMAKRVAMLQSGNHLRLTVLATVQLECAVAGEARYHRQFAEHRFRGEWFAPHPDLLAEIERLKDLGKCHTR